MNFQPYYYPAQTLVFLDHLFVYLLFSDRYQAGLVLFPHQLDEDLHQL